MNTKTDLPTLTPAEYARALGHTRALASAATLAELDELKARRRAIIDSKRRLDEQEAALNTRAANLLAKEAQLDRSPAEPTTTIHPAAATLTAPTPPTPTPAAPEKIKVPTYKPLPDKQPRRRLPTPDHKDAESVRKWARLRWPDSSRRAALRARTAKADEDRYKQDRAEEKQGK